MHLLGNGKTIHLDIQPDRIQILAAHLIVNYGHIKIAQLLQGVCQVGMRLGHLGVQQDAAVIEGNALLILTQLVVDGPNQQQQVCSMSVLGINL